MLENDFPVFFSNRRASAFCNFLHSVRFARQEARDGRSGGEPRSADVKRPEAVIFYRGRARLSIVF
jgi:hypothetical protein